MLSNKALTRFESRIRRSQGCWTWTGRTLSSGYGLFDTREIRRGPVLAHRIAYGLANGNVMPPDDKNVCHSCDNPPCCNPAHLFLGSDADNMRDASRKGRLVRAERSIRRGAVHHAAKLTEPEVLQIRELGAMRVLQRQIAERFGVTKTLVGLILNRKVWTHI